MCALACVLGPASPARAISILESAVYRGHTYHLLEPSTWLDAEAAAVGLGGHLVTIDDQLENDFVSAQFGTIRSLWIGLSDHQVEGTFVWASGASLGYTNWAPPSEPNDCHRPDPSGPCVSEDFVTMYQDWGPQVVGRWNDLTNDLVPLSGVVEVVPEPSSLALLGLGAATLVTRLRRR